MPSGVHDGHKINTEDDFWNYVKIGEPSDCWIWQSTITVYGYGLFSLNKRLEHAHRFAWEFINGSIPNGKHILHICDDPACCNPAHLYCGTPQDNANDRMNRTRHYFGDRHHWSKLTAKKVKDIRRVYKENPQCHRVIAEAAGVSRRTIGRIINRKIWKQV